MCQSLFFDKVADYKIRDSDTRVYPLRPLSQNDSITASDV